MKELHQNITKDSHGQYLVNGKRILVKYIRGRMKPFEQVWHLNMKGRLITSYRLFDNYDGPSGCVVAIQEGNSIRYGFSLCNMDAGDLFDRHEAVNLAVVRAFTTSVCRLGELAWFVETSEGHIKKDAPIEDFSACSYLEDLYWRSRNYFRSKP